MPRLFRPSLLHRYILTQFLVTLGVCLFAAVSIFVVADFFEKMRIFVREDSAVIDAVSYIFYNTPLIVHLMLPVSALVATLICVGRLSQTSEITGMRASGVSIFYLLEPLLSAGILISILMFASGETLVPWTVKKADEIYNLDIKRKIQKGTLDQTNIWYRDANRFYNIGGYDSRHALLRNISIYQLDKDKFALSKRIDASVAKWNDNTQIRWTMEGVTEVSSDEKNTFHSASFSKLPLLIEETPKDFYNMKRRAETMSYTELGRYIENLKKDGVPYTPYLIQRAAKISFPFVSFIVILIAFPFALTPARSGTMTVSFVAGVSIGFGYYVVHAFCLSLGKAELLPVWAAAWAANILLGSLGLYLLAGVEHR